MSKYLGRLWTVVWKNTKLNLSIGEVRPHPHLSQIPRKRELRGRVRMLFNVLKVPKDPSLA